jgi:hypothetical protein
MLVHLGPVPAILYQRTQEAGGMLLLHKMACTTQASSGLDDVFKKPTSFTACPLVEVKPEPVVPPRVHA